MLQLIKGDCLIEMKNIADGSIDAIITDPPYGTTACKWDAVIDFDLMWKQYKRIIKNDGVICLTAQNPFSSLLVCSNLDMFRYSLVWDKHIARGMHQAKNQPMRKHEDVLIFSKSKKNKYYPIMTKRDKPVTVKNYSTGSSTGGKYKNNNKSYTYTHKNPDSIIIGKWEANKGKIHPTQKPVTLMEYLIETYTKENETVLDNTMGSGTTGVACVNLNRNFIGIELDEDYFEIAQKRINEAQSQLKMFYT